MKKLITILLAVLFVSAASAQDIRQELNFVSNKAAPNQISVTRYLKYWNSAVNWSVSDTTEAFNFANLPQGDSVCAYYWKSSGAKYGGRILYQFGNGTTWKAAVAVDSIKRVGSAVAALVSSTADSILLGRTITFYWRRPGYYGADRIRFIVQKDTTNTASSTATMEMGVIYNKNPKALKVR